MTQNNQVTYIKQLSITRFIAAVCIFMHHFARDIYPFEGRYVKSFVHHANIAVPYFFLLSGFIMMYVYSQRKEWSAKEYWYARFFRIYPLYITALLVSIFLPYYFLDMRKIDLFDFTLNIFLIQSWFSGYQITFNGPGWSLAVEAFFYLLFPFLYHKILSKNFKVGLVFGIGIWFVTQVVHSILMNYFATAANINDIKLNPLGHLGTFLLGCVTASVYLKKKEDIVVKPAIVLIMVILPMIALLMLMTLPNDIIKFHHSGLFSPLILISIVGLTLYRGRLSVLLASSFFLYLGEISYGVYLFQFPAKHITSYLNDVLSLPHWSDWRVYYHFICLMIIAIAGYHVIEQPLKKLGKKLI